MSTSSGFFAEFKTFIARGNVLDLAVGVIIGGAFSSITTSLVNDIINPILAFSPAGMNPSRRWHSSCPEAALSRYQLPAVSAVADSQGLDDPVAADGFRQLRQRSGSEFPSGLVGVGSDLLHRKPTDLRVQHARHLLTGSETAGVPGSACIVAPGSGGNVGKSVGKLKKHGKFRAFFANRLL